MPNDDDDDDEKWNGFGQPTHTKTRPTNTSMYIIESRLNDGSQLALNIDQRSAVFFAEKSNCCYTAQAFNYIGLTLTISRA